MVQTVLPFWVQILVTLNLYWIYILPAVLLGGIFGLMRMFTMPLLTRNPHELVIIFGSSKAKVYKVVGRYLPFFLTKKGAYWFSDAAPLGHNLLHVYFEGVNQPVYALKRNVDKESHIMSHRENITQIKGHTVLIPPSMRTFARNWVLIIKYGTPADKDKPAPITVELKTAKSVGLGKQPYKLGLFKRIGVYQVSQQVAEGANASKQLQTITVQNVIEKVGGNVKGMNFSSSFSGRLIKNVRRVERNWQMLLTGGFDMRVILVMIVMFGIIAMAYLLFLAPNAPLSPQAQLPPPPPGVKLPN
jgi:hypothetical protein